MPNDPMKRDPTRTTVLRRQYRAAARKRVRMISDLTAEEIRLLFGRRYAFIADADLLQQFNSWFSDQVDRGLLDVNKQFLNEPWMADYAESAYRQAAIRSFIDAKRTKEGKKSITQTREQFLLETFNSQVAVSQIRMLGIRAFENMKGVTADMKKNMNMVLSESMSQGWNVSKTVKEFKTRVSEMGKMRAERVVRTELVHAYAEGQLDSLSKLGLEDVGLMVEWTTAGDPCPLCSAQSGITIKIQDARGMIPFHPNCRCSWVPVISGIM